MSLDNKVAEEENNKVEYESSELLYDLSKNEYDNETNRKRDLETRSGILIALTGALIGLFFTVIDISIVTKGTTIAETVFYSLLSLGYFFPLLYALLSLKSFIDVIVTRDYTRMDVNGVSEETALVAKDVLALRLANSYKNAVIENEKLNDEKAKCFKNGINKLFVSFVAFPIIYFVHIVLKLVI